MCFNHYNFNGTWDPTSLGVSCQVCGGYIVAPNFWWGTCPPRMCTCTPPGVQDIKKGWECPRCHTINSPFKDSCGCKETFNSNITFTDGQTNL